MLAKETKWTISYYHRDDCICILRDSLEEVFAFLLKESRKPDYLENRYRIYPPNTNLTIAELQALKMPAVLSDLFSKQNVLH